MIEDKLLTVREVSLILGLTEKEVIDLAEQGILPAYKIGGVYLRFKKEQVLDFKKANKHLLSSTQSKSAYTFKDRIYDFLYFNDFYIIAIAIIIFLLFIVF